ncbi:hypothetical protein [Anaerolinea thermophila]|nr:hypothetical protein [Anaerolinea thermophila]
MTENKETSLPGNGNVMEYQPDYFVDRKGELDLVRNMLTGHEKAGSRVILVEGERGMGKTWLALHLHRTVLTKSERVKSLLVLMVPPSWAKSSEREYCVPSLENADLKQTLQELLRWMAEGLGVQLPHEPALEEISDRILRHVEGDEFTRYWLLLDSVYECRWEFVELLENVFLMRFMALPNAYLWASGRGRPYPWKIPETSRAVVSSLALFNEDSLRDQLNKFMRVAEKELENRVKWVAELGKGIPLLSQTLVQTQTKEEGLKKAVALLLEVIPESRREHLRRVLERLSVLDGFREEEMAYLLEKDGQKVPLDEVRRIRDELLRVSLVRWEKSKFVMDQPLQEILQEYMKACNPEEWERLNQCMIDYYEDLRDKPAFKNYQKYLDEKILFYREAMGKEQKSNPTSAVHSPS